MEEEAVGWMRVMERERERGKAWLFVEETISDQGIFLSWPTVANFSWNFWISLSSSRELAASE
jgi:hypothetical protein